MQPTAKISSTDPQKREAATAIRAQIMAFTELHAEALNARDLARINAEFDNALAAAAARTSDTLSLEKERAKVEEVRARRLKHWKRNGGAAAYMLAQMKQCTDACVWLEKYPNGINSLDELHAMLHDRYAFCFKPTLKQIREEYEADTIGRMESFRERLRNYKG